MDESIKNILEVFSQERLSEYPRDVLDLALAREEELTPHLLGILEDLLADPSLHADRQWSYGPIFAMQLLAHFENHDAHEAIVKVMSLPKESLDPIYGDMITEDFPRVLYQTCGGRYDKIKELVLSKAADDYARGSAMKALVLGVLFGDLPRLEVMDFFAGLFGGSEAEDSSHFWDEAASCVHDLYPEELMEIITDAYDRGLIWPRYIGKESFEEALAQDKEAFLQERKSHLEMDFLDDFHEYMSWWAAFDENDNDAYEIGGDGLGAESSTIEQKKRGTKKKKARRKQAKSSRKKNRRR
ncbi:MAG: DUF1186 family protein [Proteobacteria bacterium]|nr:DUF1186 family protein [Pseudomonadota bacterium]